MLTYTVNTIDEDFELSGSAEHPCWQQARVLDQFCWPWLMDETGHIKLDKNMRFRAVHSHRWLYLLFEVSDAQLASYRTALQQRAVIDCDRVEIFLRRDAAMQPYYPLEIDPLGRVLDARAHHYRKIDFSWHWPAQDLQVKASLHEQGYCVEAALRLAALRELALLNEQQIIEAGVFRAHYFKHTALKHTADDTDAHWEPQWSSWQRPESEHPDFHIPSAFGRLQLTPAG